MLNQLVTYLKQKDENETALMLLNTMAKYAVSLEEFDTLAMLYHDLKDYESAIKWAERAMHVAPTNEALAACRANLAKLHNHANNPSKSLFYIKQNERVMPGSAEVEMEKAFSLFLLNKKTESESLLREIYKREDIDDSMRAKIEFNFGTYDLYAGKFKQGLRGFICGGKKIQITSNANLPFPKWEGGEAAQDQRIVILAEAGIGDEIINFRFCQQLRERGMIPIWLSFKRPDLQKVFKRHGIRCYDNLQTLMKAEGQDLIWCYCMELPVFLDLDETQLWNGAYLKADEQHIAAWKELLPQLNSAKTKIGLRWNGNPYYDHDLHRGIPLNRLYEAMQVLSGNRILFSLQRDDNADEVKEYSDVVDLSSKLQTWDDTLAIISQLDLVVTSCTSIAHAAAALDIPTLVFVPISAYYTWASTHDQSSIWYSDKVRVLRQTEPNNWDEPFAQLIEILQKENI